MPHQRLCGAVRLPVNATGKYDRDQMEFHMLAFVGMGDYP